LDVVQHVDAIKDHFRVLLEVDPMRRGYYRSRRSA
jgi:hypothetical protein